MSQQILNDITKTGIRLLLEEPFYGHLFSSLLRELDPQIPSLSLTVSERQPSLTVNPEYWQDILDDSNGKYGLIKHQILHLALKHPFRKSQYQHQNIFDMAADLVVNQYIHPQHLADDAITMDKYPLLRKLKKGMDVGYYYTKILEIKENEKDPNQPFPDENNEQLQQHNGWDIFNQNTRMDQRMMEGALEDALVQAAERSQEKLQGLLPGELYRLIQERLEKRKKQLDWRRVLRIFIGSGRKTFIKNTIRRPSKRYGTTPGIQVKQKQKILVALDTSGSVSTDELSVFFSEMTHIKRQGVEIMVAECDARLQRTYLLGTYPSFEVKGGGGTDFTPVIQYANDTYHPDALVYFTDGYGHAPEVLSQCPLLWLISKDGIQIEDDYWKNLPGRKVRMSS